jgi:hypothetical protein
MKGTAEGDEDADGRDEKPRMNRGKGRAWGQNANVEAMIFGTCARGTAVDVIDKFGGNLTIGLEIKK